MAISKITSASLTDGVDVSFNAGSAAAPSVSPAGDTNTGIFFPAADTIAFAEGGAEAMRINSSGNVGIGTSSPVAYGTRRTLAIDGTGGVVVDLFVAGTRTGTIVAETNDLQIGTIANGPTRFLTNGLERARIDSSGNLLVGTTSQYGSGLVSIPVTGGSTWGITIQNTNTSTATNINFRNSSATGVGSITSTTTTTAFNTSSDYRLKHDIAPMTGALARVQQLNPVTYKWNADDSAGEGFIAHELQAVCPDAVTGEKDAVDAEGSPVYQGVDTSFLVATLTAAIQELKAINDAQASRIETLEAKVAALEEQ